MFKNKKIFILGMARSGYEVAKLLSKYNNKIIINDMDKNQNPDHVNELEKLGISVVLGSHPDDLLDASFDYVIKNPGIKDTHKYIERAKKNGTEVINEIELAYHFLPKNVRIIGITGTNGKTTTTTIIYEILKKEYFDRVHLIGNMGFPLSSFIDKIKENDILVMEISVQQLVNFKDFKTDISVLTNITEAHLDHVGGFENYLNTKKKIFNNHSKADIAIINKNDINSLKITNNINSNKLYFSLKENTDCYVKENNIYYNNEKIISLSDIRLIGNHNYENIMCAISACKNIGIKNTSIKEVLKNFSGVEHRLEFVTQIKNRKFYNDSKATNNKSTMIALSSFKNPIILIMGGLDRNIPFDELKDYVSNVKIIICYGETKNKLKEFADSVNKRCYIVDNLIEATKLSYEYSEENDIILLSPACASWDQYKCFEDRGTEFKNTVFEIERNEENGHN